MQGMKIAQAALAILDVRLDPIARLAGPAVALVALRELRFHELLGGAMDDLTLEAPHQVLEKRFVAENETGVQQRSAYRDVSAREFQRLLDIACSVAHLEPEVPQQIEHVFDDAFTPGRLPVRQQEKQIDVGVGSEQPPPIAAGCNDGHVLGI